MEGAQGGDTEGLTRRTKGAKGNKGERDEVITAKFDQERGESPFEGDRGCGRWTACPSSPLTSHTLT